MKWRLEEHWQTLEWFQLPPPLRASPGKVSRRVVLRGTANAREISVLKTSKPVESIEKK